MSADIDPENDGEKLSASNPLKNPFRKPTANNWCELHLQRKKEEIELRQSERKKPIHEKHTYKTRTMGAALPRIRHELDEMCEASSSELNPPHNYAHDFNIKPIEKIDIHELISRKREMFLMEFALQTRKDALAQIVLQTRIENEKMDAAELHLCEDTSLFDEFLRATHEAATDAVKRADYEVQRKNDMLIKEKSISIQISQIKSEICRLEDKFAEISKYRKFIMLVDRNRREKDKLPIVLEDFFEYDVENEDEDIFLKLPFDDPDEMRALIFELEEHNLSLIGHFQTSEEAVDEIKVLFLSTEKKLNQQIVDLQSHMDVMQSTVDRFIIRAEELAFFCRMFADGSAEFNEQEEMLAELTNKIERVYNIVIGKLDVAVDGLIMLTSIETRMEDLIDIEEKFSAVRVREAQRERDKQRRIQAREEQSEEQRRKQGDRTRRAQERLQATMDYHNGRRLVQRSRPPARKNVLAVDEDKDDEDKDADFFK